VGTRKEKQVDRRERVMPMATEAGSRDKVGEDKVEGDGKWTPHANVCDRVI
jgi:hypothetical protein